MDSPLCSCCPTLPETSIHVLFHCKCARKIWKRLLPKMPLPSSPFLSFQDSLSEISNSLNPNDTELAACTCWALWSDRNSLLQNKQAPTIEAKCEWISKYVTSFRNAQPLHRKFLPCHKAGTLRLRNSLRYLWMPHAMVNFNQRGWVFSFVTVAGGL